METPRRKPGRPKASQQTLPLVLEDVRRLETLEVAIPESTAETLAEYTDWVRHCREMTTQEAVTAAIDYALRELFRRDRLWRNRGREEGGGIARPAAATPRPLPTALPEPRAVAAGTTRPEGGARLPPHRRKILIASPDRRRPP